MLRLPLIVLALLLVPLLTAAERPTRPNPPYQRAQSTDPQEGWSQESAGKDVVIYSRARAGSSIREFRAVGVIEAATGAVFAVIDDSESYPRFMPYTSETRVLKREKNSVLAYQRLELPLVSDRDYTLRSRHQRWLSPDGPIYWIRWQPANDQGPPLSV